jgi:hypothetical protein
VRATSANVEVSNWRNASLVSESDFATSTGATRYAVAVVLAVSS